MLHVNNNNVELGEREVSALHRENTGPAYKREAVIKDRAIEAEIEAALVPVKICSFRNKYGFCVLKDGHTEKHTVVFLGDDDDWQDDM